MRDWDAVVAHALTLPGGEVATSYGKPAVKVGGKTIVALTAPDAGSFVLHVPVEEKEVLIETDPDTFWETPHYVNWPAVLVRYGADEADERVKLYIRRAWWDRLRKPQKQAYGERP